MDNNNDIDWIVSITKDELATLPVANFKGKIHLVDSAEDAEHAVEALRKSDIIGFDTETKPSFKKGQNNNVALVQMATRDECFLFRICHIGLCDSLKSLLEDPDKLKIGLSIHDDFHNLNKKYELQPAGFVDLQNFAKEYRIADNSLTKIYALLFGKRISKSQRLTNWEAQSLSSGQQSYAALDAIACVRIYDKLKSGEFIPTESKYFRPAPPPPNAKPEHEPDKEISNTEPAQ